MNKRSFESLIVLLLIAFLLTACGPSAPPQARAGIWEATTDFGELSFTVDPSGTTITGMSWNYTSCPNGNITFSNDLNFENGLPIEDDKFTFDFGDFLNVKVEGRFSRDGTQASGSWTAGDCSGRWVATTSR